MPIPVDPAYDYRKRTTSTKPKPINVGRLEPDGPGSMMDKIGKVAVADAGARARQGVAPPGMGVASRMVAGVAERFMLPRSDPGFNPDPMKRQEQIHLIADRNRPDGYSDAMDRSPGRPSPNGLQQAGMGPPEPIAGRQDRLRDQLIQQELIARKQLGTIGKDEGNAIAGQLRMNKREFDLADSSRRTAPPIKSAAEYAESTRRSDESLMNQMVTQAKPLMDRVSAGETLTPEQSAELARYNEYVEGQRRKLDTEQRTDLGDGNYKVDFGPDTDYYAKRGEAGVRAAETRNQNFTEARGAERALAMEMARRREQATSDATTMDRATFEANLAAERERGAAPGRNASFQQAQVETANKEAETRRIRAENETRRAEQEGADFNNQRSPEARTRRSAVFNAIMEEQGVNPETFDKNAGDTMQAVFSALDGDNDFRGARGIGNDPKTYVEAARTFDQLITALERTAQDDPVSARQRAIPYLDAIRRKIGNEPGFDVAFYMNRISEFSGDDLKQIADSMNASYDRLKRIVGQ